VDLGAGAELLEPQHLARQLEQSRRELKMREQELQRLQHEIPRLQRLIAALEAMGSEAPLAMIPHWSPDMPRADAVRVVLMEAPGPFTAHDVLKELERRGYEETSENPLHSTQAALSRLAQTYKDIKRMEQGVYAYQPETSNVQPRLDQAPEDKE
jgi:hypothetical protein